MKTNNDNNITDEVILMVDGDQIYREFHTAQNLLRSSISLYKRTPVLVDIIIVHIYLSSFPMPFIEGRHIREVGDR